MSLTETQVRQLHEAIRSYDFPAIYYDFSREHEVAESSMSNVERFIGDQLRSISPDAVKYGLMNVLYWGYARVPYRNRRVQNLRNGITGRQLNGFQGLLKQGMPTMVQIKALRIPQYSGISFLSKVLMFLNPAEYCVLDKKIAGLRTHDSSKALNGLTFGPRDTQIRVSSHNEQVYNRWRKECLDISREYFSGQCRVVDVERGLFHLIQTGHLSDAQTIYREA